MDSLKEFVESSSVIVEALFDKQGGTINPMYHVVCPSGEGVMPALGADLGKDASLKLMREVLKQLEATRVLYIDEAWVLIAAPDYEPDGSSLEHHPDRVEEVIFLAEDIEEGSMMASRRIVRDGDKATLDPLVFKNMGTFSGRMAGMLPTEGRAH